MSHAPAAVYALFQSHTVLRGVIDSALEGRLGRITVDDPEAAAVARLELGCYAVFGGVPDHDGATRLIQSVELPREILLPDDQRWRDLFFQVYGARGEDRPMRTFSTHSLDVTALRAMILAVGDGVVIERLDHEGARTLDRDLEPHGLQVFPSVDDFVEGGVGFRAVSDRRTLSVASSYAASSRRIEVAIATHPEARGRGLAQAVAARMLIHCIENDITPEWSASNPASKRLALRLGYRLGPLCDAVYVEALES